MKKAQVTEFFERLAAHIEAPTTELDYRNPYTLLVAVVLSAQATDKGVNKATKALFAEVETPAAMLTLGEARLKEHIKTIGLFNTKAKNVIALSRALVEEHGGEVPNDRAALEALPGVGRKTANVVLNTVFGEPTIAVDTHIFRLANRSGLAPGKTPRAVEDGLNRIVPEALQTARASLADPARPLCLQGKDAGLPGLCRPRSMPLQGQDDRGGCPAVTGRKKESETGLTGAGAAAAGGSVALRRRLRFFFRGGQRDRLQIGFPIRRIVLGLPFDAPAPLDLELAVADDPGNTARRPDEEPLLNLELALERPGDVGIVHRHGALEGAALHDLEQTPVRHRGFDRSLDSQTLAIEDRAAADGRFPTDGEPLGVALHAPGRIGRHGVGGRAARNIRVENDGLVRHPRRVDSTTTDGARRSSPPSRLRPSSSWSPLLRRNISSSAV